MRGYLPICTVAIALACALCSAKTNTNNAGTSGQWYRPAVDVSWHWQLKGTLSTRLDATLYDVDLFATPATTIAYLKKKKHRIICYFSAGSFEPWHEDIASIPDAAIGKQLEGWEEENWLDIRADAVKDWAANRLQLAADKGCDGVEPDNVDGYQHDTGFNLTAQEQLGFNRFIATRAHELGLAVGLKNNLQQIPLLVDYYDFAVNERCFEFTECDRLLLFIRAGKPVLNAEYQPYYANNAGARAKLCTKANKLGLRTLILPEELDGRFRFSCFDN